MVNLALFVKFILKSDLKFIFCREDEIDDIQKVMLPHLCVLEIEL